jgi:hypothetical protein
VLLAQSAVIWEIIDLLAEAKSLFDPMIEVPPLRAADQIAGQIEELPDEDREERVLRLNEWVGLGAGPSAPADELAHDDVDDEAVEDEPGARGPPRRRRLLETVLAQLDEDDEEQDPDFNEDKMKYERMGLPRVRKRMAQAALIDFAQGRQERLRSLGARFRRGRWFPPGAQIDVELVLECLDIWCTRALYDEVTSTFHGTSLDAIWMQFGLSYAKRGGAQLAALIRRLLALPASQTAVERANKTLRRIWEKCRPQLRANVELSRLVLATCRSPSRLRAEAAMAMRNA